MKNLISIRSIVLVFTIVASGIRCAEAGILFVGAGETYATIQDAYNAAQNGDTLLIDDGVYTQSSTFLVQKQVTFEAAHVGKAIISGGGSGPDDAVFRLESDAAFIGLHLENATNGLYQRDAGVHGIAENLVITNVTNAIGINNSGSATGSFDVLNNTIVGAGTGIYINDGGTINVTNTIFDNVGTAYGAHDNIAINPDHDLLFNVTTVSSTTSTGHVSADSAQIVADPRFVSPTAGNYHLLPNSPAIDSGVYDGLPYYGSAPDRGAFEATPEPTSAVCFLGIGAAGLIIRRYGRYRQRRCPAEHQTEVVTQSR